ncbi:MAG: ADP-ribosylglycohydrolase family protein [Bacteroides sp.]|nr:ADP-ribosylglycohydrolase family protein [Bacteroides sp.]MCM1457275.1 ADP-ribosylglycohydrolase family protein [Lachnoclostridium sp.]
MKNKMLGCLYGQAVGDALGFGAEAMSLDDVKINYPNGLSRYSQIIQDKRRAGWPIGWWTDDTEMMLLILDSYVAYHDFNLLDLAKRFLDWYNVIGYRCCGILTKKALNFAPPVYEKSPITVAEMVWKLKGGDNAPNGGLMRTSIVGLFPENVEQYAKEICQMTHFDPRCVASCVIATVIINNLVWHGKGVDIDELLSIGERYDSRVREWIELAYNSSDISTLDLDEPKSDAYTLRTLAAALWCYFHATSFEEGLLAVVNEGGDADTNGAIACAILGAKYGYDAIPRYYIDNLHRESEYRQKVNNFIELVINEEKQLD